MSVSQRRGVFTISQDHGDGRVDFHALGSGRYKNFAKLALVSGFDLHRRLVGLDLGDDIARVNLVAFGFHPFGKFALFHRGRQG